MVGLRFVLLTALVPLLGAWARHVPSVRTLPFIARLSVYFAAGLVTLTLEMWLLSVLGIRWNLALLLILPLLAAAVPRFLGVPRSSSAERYSFHSEEPEELRGTRGTATVTLLSLATFASAAFSAAVTSGDFVLHWGVKGQRFGQMRTLDTAFMIDPSHYMHPDYPPLVPLYYAWTMLGGDGRLDWFGGISSAALFFVLSAAAMWGLGRYAGIRLTESATALFAALFALLYIRNSVAGNGEPALIFFEVLALSAILARQDFVATLALTGAVLAKVEGGVFVALVLALTWIARDGTWRQRLIDGIKIAILPSLTLFAWLWFAVVRGITDTYRPKGDLDARWLIPTSKEMLQELSLGLWYTPWIAAALLLLAAARFRKAAPYLLASLGFIGFLIAIHLREVPHLQWNAGRTLMTPLVLLLFAGVAASPRGSSPYNARPKLRRFPWQNSNTTSSSSEADRADTSPASARDSSA